MANSRSSAGLASLRRPVRTSRKPTARSGGALQLSLEPLQGRYAGLERWVGREEVGHALAGARREDVEGGQLTGRRAQVTLRQDIHRSADLHQGRDECAGAAGEDGRAPVGGELAV